jgi:hypothetical protein
MKSSPKRIALILAVGIGVAVVGDWVMSHPYFDLVLWTDTTVWQHRDDGNHEILLQAACSSVLPRHIRIKAFEAAVYVRDFDDTDVSLPNNQIARLMEYFAEEDYPLTDFLFHQPFLEERINPKLADIALDPSLPDYDRLSAFGRITEAQPMTEQKAEMIFQLWMIMDSPDIQTRIQEAITTPPRCGPEVFPSNLVTRFKTIEKANHRVEATGVPPSPHP